MTVLNPALHDTLRTLKLTGMLETLDARVAQARTGALGHLDFLQVACEDEIARRETSALARRLRLARFEEQATIESFDFTVNPKVPGAALRDLATLRWLDAGQSVILYRPTGVGKTHIAQALGHNVIRRGGQVRFVKTSPVLAVLADLAGGHADRTWERRLREYTRPAVVILDDFAMRELTAAQADDLYELVSERAIASRPLILTSNRAPADWYALFPNPVVAESLPRPARPADQHQPPSPHGRTQLPTPHTTPASRTTARTDVTVVTTPQRQRPVDTPRACYYADDPTLRPRGTLTPSVQLGDLVLCASCNAARSTLGKGHTPVPLPPGPAFDVLGWVTTAHQQAITAETTLAAAVTRARQAGTSWAAIGAHLGLTRQGAQQRFTRRPSTRPSPQPARRPHRPPPHVDSTTTHTPE